MWKFEIVSLEKANPPSSGHKGHWYRYTIANRITEISGMRRGSKAEVMSFVSTSIQRLNNRHRSAAFSRR
ncbi:MAG: hypothetical protein OQK54_00825 [Gammaproteobacteria bacterium]|nr:hypothetical protein [Gammaproteobacteria bacterium]